MTKKLNFDQRLYEQWFIENAAEIYAATGIGHYAAQNSGMLKIIFIQQQRIDELQQTIDQLKGTR